MFSNAHIKQAPACNRATRAELGVYKTKMWAYEWPKVLEGGRREIMYCTRQVFHAFTKEKQLCPSIMS